MINTEMSTIKHDVLQMKLMDKEIWRKIILSLCENPDLLSSVDDIKIEVPVLTDSNFIVGYIDIVVDFHMKYPTKDRNEWHHDEMHHRIFCEIKPAEPSFGSVVRQVKQYETHISNRQNRNETYLLKGIYEHIWLVISPYPEWQKHLMSQGIYWLDSRTL